MVKIKVNIGKICEVGYELFTFKDGNKSFKKFLKKLSPQVIYDTQGKEVFTVEDLTLKQTPLMIVAPIMPQSKKSKAIREISRLIQENNITEEEISGYLR